RGRRRAGRLDRRSRPALRLSRAGDLRARRRPAHRRGKAAAQAAGREPVLALMPVPGDVDIVLASELMEAARAVERGFVTPDKTLLIASTLFAMTEKIVLVDGRADAAALLSACREAARELRAFNMA